MRSDNRDTTTTAAGCFVDEDMQLFKAFVIFKAFDPKFIQELRRLRCQYPHPEGWVHDADKEVLEHFAANILLGLAPIANRNGFQDMSCLVENFGSEISCKDIALLYSGFCCDKDQVVDILQELVESKNPSGFFQGGNFERDLSVKAECEFKIIDIALAYGKADFEQRKAAGIFASAPHFDLATDLEDLAKVFPSKFRFEDIVSACCQAEFDKNLAKAREVDKDFERFA
ncbi:unnamed protein product [Dovyalis caffra]|uniref:Uncharacterized protein n=1 Tax=Dovyalis caffra TaxID=77055 RepID=A0AAV1SNT5_9ROSI|nr:unnamed protein product [Dovyalis caffra]